MIRTEHNGADVQLETPVENIDVVVANDLCTACGACASVCPQDAISMVETPWGMLYANRDGTRCTGCGLCARVCPGWHVADGLLPAGLDPFKGKILAAFKCQASDGGLLSDAQSGGAATALLYHLLQLGQVDKAVVTQMPDDGTLRPKVLVTADREQISRARGSKYCPVPLNAALAGAGSQEEKLAFVGVACHVHGLRNAQRLGLHHNVRFTIGLICSGISAYGQIDHLVRMSKVRRDQVVGFRYKSKKWHGWPGDVLIRTRDGVEHNLLRAAFIRSRDVFAPPCCRLCFDQLNVLSDVSVGDAHHISDDPEGVSLVLARTQRGLDALNSAAAAGVLKLTSVEPREACETSQCVELRREAWTASTRLWRQMRHVAPDFHIEERWAADVDKRKMSPYRRKLKWGLRLARFDSWEQALRAARRRLFAEALVTAIAPKRVIREAKRRLASVVRRFLSNSDRCLSLRPTFRRKG